MLVRKKPIIIARKEADLIGEDWMDESEISIVLSNDVSQPVVQLRGKELQGRLHLLEVELDIAEVFSCNSS